MRSTRFASLALLALLAPAASTHAGPSEEGKARWIAVFPPALRDPITPLVEHRRAEGFDVVLLQTTDVLDAEAIRSRDGARLRERVAALCREAKGRCSVLLVGAVGAALPGPEGRPPDAEASKAVVPALRGTVDRMAGEPSDNGYGRLDEDLLPDVAVGRFPARSADEARAMVTKTLAFEERARRAPWRDRLTLLVGNPGGSSPLERRMASGFVGSTVGDRLARLHERWSLRATVDAESSPFALPSDRLAETARRWAEEGQMLLVYLGHSSASAMTSNGVDFLSRVEWEGMRSPEGQGLLFTCGCHACEIHGGDGEGYGTVAMRSAGGPVAVIGAHGETYGALGELATDGLITVLSSPTPPVRLGDWWLAAARGIAEGSMSPFRFLLYDRSDGSGGKVPLDVQRREHLERWMLLGDPALRLPVDPPEVLLELEGDAVAGGDLRVRGTLPPRLGGAAVRVVLERPFGSAAPGTTQLPTEEGEARDQALLDRHARANRVEVAAAETTAADGRFECRLPIPAEVPWKRLVVRARASGEGGDALGVTTVSVAR